MYEEQGFFDRAGEQVRVKKTNFSDRSAYTQDDVAPRGCATRSPIGAKRGGARRNRTADLLNAIQALSQLSYDPTMHAEPGLGSGPL